MSVSSPQHPRPKPCAMLTVHTLALGGCVCGCLLLALSLGLQGVLEGLVTPSRDLTPCGPPTPALASTPPLSPPRARLSLCTIAGACPSLMSSLLRVLHSLGLALL